MMNVWMILGAIGMGSYTAAGLHFYSLLANRTRNPVLRILFFSLFMILFAGGGFVVCGVMNIFSGGGKTTLASPYLAPLTLLSWVGTVLFYIALNWRALRRRFNPVPAEFRPLTLPHQLGHVRALDGLRGFAIICVLLFHGSVLKGGFIGVDIFFVLSGFLITTLLVQEFNRTKSVSLRNFYLRRVLRLGPALIAMLIVFCALSFVILSPPAARNNCLEAIIALAYLTNWARAFWFHSPQFLGHTWSLSIEEQFYIIWPLLLLILLRIVKNPLHIVPVVSFLALFAWFLRVYFCLQGTDVVRMYNGLDTRADSLMTGCTLGVILSGGLLEENIKRLFQRALVFLAPLSLAGLLALAVHAGWRDSFMYYHGFVTIELLAAILILDVLICPRSLVKNFFAMRWLAWVGSISYGLYLWHVMIFFALEGFGFGRTVVFFIGTLLTFMVSTLSYYAMEKPVRMLKKQ